MSGDELQFVVFRLGSQEFALSIGQVERVLRYESPAVPADSPHAPEEVIAYAGGMVPLVDLRRRLSLKAPQHEETRVMILQLDAHRVGVVVDQVREVLRVDARTIAVPPPTVRGLPARYLSGIMTRPGRTIIVLNPGRLLTSDERLALEEVLL